jgi:hypothetical protein
MDHSVRRFLASYYSGRHYTNLHIYSPGAGVPGGVMNAFEVLRGACAKRSRFD